MKKRIVICLLSACALSFAQNVSAGNRAGAISITPEIGYYGFAQKRHLRNVAAVPAFALGYNFFRNWGIEFAYANVNTRYASDAGYTGSVKGNLYTIDGVYHFNPIFCSNLEPYVDLGLGVLSLNPNGTSATNEANVNGALGLQLFFSDSIALRGEARDLYTMSGGKNDWMVDVGVSFLFGGNEPVVVYKDVPKDQVVMQQGDN